MTQMRRGNIARVFTHILFLTVLLTRPVVWGESPASSKTWRHEVFLGEKLTPLKAKPSEYFTRQCYISCDPDEWIGDIDDCSNARSTRNVQKAVSQRKEQND